MELSSHPDCDGNSRKKLCNFDCDLCFSRSFASSEYSSMWSNINDVEARQEYLRSEHKHSFYCDKCKHTFISTPRCVSKSGCPFCCMPCKKLCEKMECQICYDRSFASVPLLDEWSPDNEKQPRDVFRSSHSKYKFICSREGCRHEFETGLNKMTNDGNRCPYCSKSGRKLCPDKECDICVKTSFEPILAKKTFKWSTKNKGKPSEYPKAAKQKFLFDCSICKHEFSTSLSHISSSNRGCPYCAKPSKKLCKDEECNFCHDRSFAVSQYAKFWSKKNEGTPRDYLYNSHKKFIFDCQWCKKEFENDLQSIVIGVWCLCRTRKTEAKLKEWLEEMYPDQITYQPKYDWCLNSRTGRQLPFDFSLENMKLIIELDGAQHFRQVSNWAPFEQTQLRDRYKERKALENDYSVIRILQEDVLSDKIDWEVLLEQSISRSDIVLPSVISTNRQRKTPTITLLYAPDGKSRTDKNANLIEYDIIYEVKINYIESD